MWIFQSAAHLKFIWSTHTRTCARACTHTRVFIHGSYSSEGTVKYGVPKGSVLGPVLFCIYINDLLPLIPSNSVECHMLADDTTLHTTGESLKSIMQLQKHNSFVLTRSHCWQQILMASLDQTHAKSCQKINNCFFFLHCNIIIININTKTFFYNTHIKPHIDYVSAVRDGYSEVHFIKYLTLHRRVGKLIFPDPSLSTEQKISAFRMLNLPQQFTKAATVHSKNEEIFMHKVLNNNSANNLAQLFTGGQSPFSFSFLSFCLMSSDAKENIRDNL